VDTKSRSIYPYHSYTIALQKEYGIIMPGFPQLNEKDIDAILDYIEASEPQSMPVAMD
jgi:hypothetical protein